MVTTIGRRHILQGLGALGASSLISAQSFGAKKPLQVLDPDNARDQALIYRKLAWSMDDRLGFWWIRGTRYGVVDNDLTPLWNAYDGTFFKTRDLPNGEYEVTALSIDFYTDLKTGEYLKKTINPLTGKEMNISYMRANPPKPRKMRFKAEGGRAEPSEAPGIVFHGTTGPAWIEGDQAWVRADNIVRFTPKENGPTIRVNDMSTYSGSVRDIADPAIKMPLASQMFNDMNSWSADMEMADRTGSSYSRYFGRKVASYDEMPAVWRKLMLQEYPDIAKDPAKILQG